MVTHSELNDRTVVIVGAGSGIGSAIALAASHAGARVILVGRTQAALEATAAELIGPHAIRTADVTREEDVVALVRDVGSFDHLVSTASQGAAGPLVGLPTERIAAAVAAKLWAAVYLVKHGAPRITAGGSFTFFSGYRGARPAIGSSITSLVNGGLEAFARAMAVELGPTRVNVISPGIVDSGPFWNRLSGEAREQLFSDFAAKAPARRVGRCEDQAAAALFAMTNGFVTGTVLAVDGGALVM